jgi:hypothetical protein
MHFHISPELEQRIADEATAAGFSSVEGYLAAVLRQRVPAVCPPLEDAEFIQLLDELASDDDLPSLPANFSRADIYVEDA